MKTGKNVLQKNFARRILRYPLKILKYVSKIFWRFDTPMQGRKFSVEAGILKSERSAKIWKSSSEFKLNFRNYQ